jgi:hypothetical protein
MEEELYSAAVSLSDASFKSLYYLAQVLVGVPTNVNTRGACCGEEGGEGKACEVNGNIGQSSGHVKKHNVNLEIIKKQQHQPPRPPWRRLITREGAMARRSQNGRSSCGSKAPNRRTRQPRGSTPVQAVAPASTWSGSM